MTLLLVGIGAMALLLLLAMKLRGGGDRGDLLGPPSRQPPRPSPDLRRRLRGLLAERKLEEAMRLAEQAGYDMSVFRRMIPKEPPAAPAGTPPEPGWTETVRGEDGLAYGRGFAFDPALHDADSRGKQGEFTSARE
jgi:hypothetical protein